MARSRSADAAAAAWACDRCGSWDIRVASDHGDPYDFPRAVPIGEVLELPAAGSQPQAGEPHTGPSPVSRAVRGTGRAARAVWMGLAHLVGGSARSVGSPTTVEPELRRD